MKKTILSTMAAIFFLASCAEENRSNNRRFVVREGQNANAQRLSDKTTAEILDAKYNWVMLTCSLRVQKAAEIDFELTPNDSISFDLKTSTVFPQVFKLNSIVDNHQIQATLEILGVGHHRVLNHTDAQGNSYYAQFSPYVKINYSHTSDTIWENGGSLRESTTALKNVNERIKEIVLSQTLRPKKPAGDTVVSEEGTSSYSQHLDCTLTTDIKDAYESQFSVIRTAP